MLSTPRSILVVALVAGLSAACGPFGSGTSGTVAAAKSLVPSSARVTFVSDNGSGLSADAGPDRAEVELVMPGVEASARIAAVGRQAAASGWVATSPAPTLPPLTASWSKPGFSAQVTFVEGDQTGCEGATNCVDRIIVTPVD